MARMTWNDKAPLAVRAAAFSGLVDGAHHVLEESNRTAPIEESTLIKSGKVTPFPVEGVAVVSYDTPYARRQHEDTRLRHDPGRRAKWLERTLSERRAAVLAFVAAKVRAVTR